MSRAASTSGPLEPCQTSEWSPWLLLVSAARCPRFWRSSLRACAQWLAFWAWGAWKGPHCPQRAMLQRRSLGIHLGGASSPRSGTGDAFAEALPSVMERVPLDTAESKNCPNTPTTAPLASKFFSIPLSVQFFFNKVVSSVVCCVPYNRSVSSKHWNDSCLKLTVTCCRPDFYHSEGSDLWSWWHAAGDYRSALGYGKSAS